MMQNIKDFTFYIWSFFTGFFGMFHRYILTNAEEINTLMSVFQSTLGTLVVFFTLLVAIKKYRKK